MANLITVNENETEIEVLSCNTRLIGVNQRILFSAFNIPLSIVAFLGNILIIFALQKPSSLHPSSKLLFGCLAVTDLDLRGRYHAASSCYIPDVSRKLQTL